MRIAFVGSEAYAAMPFALLQAGHEITHLVGPRSSVAAPVTRAMVEARAGLRWRSDPVTRETIEEMHRSRPDFMLCAGYPRRLDVRPGDPVPAVNYHPSPLPEGRGPAPIQWAILAGRQATAVTFHEMVERFDSGPILLQRELPLSPRETSPSLESRCRQLGAQLAVELTDGFETFWAGRREQGPGTYCRMPRRPDRTLDLHGPVQDIDRVLRAFTPGSIFVEVDGRPWVVFDAVCWPELHGFAPGSLVAPKGGKRLLAAADGYVLLRSALPERIARLRLAAGNLKRFLR